MNSREMDPVRIGVPTRRPNSVSLRPSRFLISIPMIEKTVHRAKQAVKEMVLAASAQRRWPSVAFICSIIADPRRGGAHACGRPSHLRRAQSLIWITDAIRDVTDEESANGREPERDQRRARRRAARHRRTGGEGTPGALARVSGAGRSDRRGRPLERARAKARQPGACARRRQRGRDPFACAPGPCRRTFARKSSSMSPSSPSPRSDGRRRSAASPGSATSPANRKKPRPVKGGRPGLFRAQRGRAGEEPVPERDPEHRILCLNSTLSAPPGVSDDLDQLCVSGSIQPPVTLMCRATAGSAASMRNW